jgi:FlaG/FlaF family flagellin (archaellin)
MNKNVVIGIIAGVVAIAVIMGGWFIFSANGSANNTVTPTPTNSRNADATASADATAEAEVSAKPIPTSEQSVKEANQEVDDSRKFTDAEAVSNFSKEDVQSILRSSTDYTYAALTNTNLLSGAWYKNGRDMNAFADGISQYFSTKLREQIQSIPLDDPAFGKKTQTLSYFVVSGDQVTASPACAPTPAGESSGPSYHNITCPGPLKISDMKYESTDTNDVPGVMVTYSVEMDVPLVLTAGNKDVYQHVKYDFKLNFINNDNYQSDATDQKFVIDYYDNNVTFGKVLG